MKNGQNNFITKKKIRLHEIKMNIVASENVNMNFQMNFISLLINYLIESSSAKKANIYPINYITKITNISNIDWCSYLFDCLVKTKQSFYLDHVIIIFLDHMLFFSGTFNNFYFISSCF